MNQITDKNIIKKIKQKIFKYNIKNVEYKFELNKINKDYLIYTTGGTKCLLIISKISCIFDIKKRKFYKIDIEDDNDKIFYIDKFNNDIIINDCFVYNNIKLNTNFIDRYKIFKKYDKFKINNFCNLESFDYLINSIKNNKNITDIIFISKYENTKYKYKLESNFYDLIKTDLSDVYIVMKNDIKQGIAYIKTYSTSLKLYNKFKNTNKINIKCQFNKKFNKWEPII